MKRAVNWPKSYLQPLETGQIEMVETSTVVTVRRKGN